MNRIPEPERTAPRERGSTKRTPGGLLAVDVLILAYIALISAVVLVRREAIPRAGPLLAAHLALGGALLLTARTTRGLAVEKAVLVRVAFACGSIPVLFLLLGGIVSQANPHHGEVALKRIDDLLFLGRNPNELLDRIQTPVLTEYLQVIYATYYFLPLALLLALLRDRNHRAIEETLLAVVACLLISYIGYFAVPATAPSMNIHHLYSWPPYEEEVRSGASTLPGLALAEPIRRILYRAETIRHDCFPSGHTAMSLVVLFLARRHHRGVYRILFIPVLSLVFSTMYLRYHYIIDVIAGVGVAVLTFHLAPKLEAAFDRTFVERRRGWKDG